MMIRIPKMRPTVSVNYENLVAALAVVYFLETVYFVTLHPELQNALWLVQLFLIGCIGLLFCIQRISVQNMLIRLLIMAVLVLSFLFSGVLPLLKYGLVILAGMRSDVDKVMRRIIKVYLICITVTIALSLINVIPSRVVRRGFITHGFVHSNVLAQYIFSVLCCYIILCKKKFGMKQWAIIVTVFAVTWFLTDSRTTVASMIFLIILVALSDTFPKVFRRGRFLYYMAIWLPVGIFLLSLLLSAHYDMTQPLLIKMDEMLNGRLAMANRLIQTLSVTAFGQEITVNAVENAYITGLYQFGVVPIFVEMIIFMYAIRKSMVTKSYGILACLLAMTVHGMAESSTFSPFVNVALLTTFAKSVRTVGPSMRKSNTNG